ncbi:MAG: DUF1932 domain-containing protein [Acidimicrobiales bacterium]
MTGGTVIGLLHPGEMGSAVAACLVRRGGSVLWASADRSEATAHRADAAGLTDAGTTQQLIRRSDVVLSICPPHGALGVARSVAGFGGTFVDANAISADTAREIRAVVESGGARFVDGGIIGPPPGPSAAARLYLCGENAGAVARLFGHTPLDARVIDGDAGAASALKMAYAAWTKGTSALLLAARAAARAHGVEEALLDEWAISLPELQEHSIRAGRSAANKGWRWIAEMEQIAATFAAAGLPDGFHRAAAEIYRRAPHIAGGGEDGRTLDAVIEAVRLPGGAGRR